jgi:hypothetical protein
MQAHKCVVKIQHVAQCSNHGGRTLPLSITYTTSSTVTDVSAIFVERMTFVMPFKVGEEAVNRKEC